MLMIVLIDFSIDLYGCICLCYLGIICPQVSAWKFHWNGVTKSYDVHLSCSACHHCWNGITKSYGVRLTYSACPKWLFNYLSLDHRKVEQKTGRKEHHLWMKRDSAGAGQKALNLVRIVSLFWHYYLILLRKLCWLLLTVNGFYLHFSYHFFL